MSVNQRLPVVCARLGDCRDLRDAQPYQGLPPTGWKRLCAEAEVPPGGMKAFSVDGVGVLVLDLGDELVAVQSLCPHEMVPLELGIVEGQTLTCLEHLWQFDVRSGEPRGEASEGLRTFSLRNEGGDLYVALD